jgi:hypothetical protein
MENKEEARVRLHFALACLILGPQIPFIYQGTEQEFCGALGLHQCQDTGNWLGHDCYVREDMFENPACVWQFGLINRKTFQPYSQNHSTFLLINQLAKIRGENKLIQSGTRTLLCSYDNGMWCVLIHGMDEQQPLLIAMNLGFNPLSEQVLKIPHCYGRCCKVDILMTTSGGLLQLVGDEIQIQLPAFTFIVGQLFRSTED